MLLICALAYTPWVSDRKQNIRLFVILSVFLSVLSCNSFTASISYPGPPLASLVKRISGVRKDHFLRDWKASVGQSGQY